MYKRLEHIKLFTPVISELHSIDIYV